MKAALATLSATLLVAALLSGCEKCTDTTGAGTTTMPPASAASR